jgi:hypothetical protein
MRFGAVVLGAGVFAVATLTLRVHTIGRCNILATLGWTLTRTPMAIEPPTCRNTRLARILPMQPPPLGF